VELGSWRDARVVRDLMILAVCVVITVFAVTLPIEVVALLLLPLAVGGLTAVLIHLRGGPAKSLAGSTEAPHPGPNASHIPLAGFPGAAFVVGYVWMFWFGAPGLRPVVVLAGVLGVLGGAALVLIGKRHRTATATPLGLHDRAESRATGNTSEGHH
jgi:hypothetical protein